MSSLSVAMCTFNGARFLPDQLASIAAQSRLPDELVVFDDASTDETRGLLESFRTDAPFPVRLDFQTSNQGSTASFEAAIAACRSDVIALADQDDFWEPGKLASLERMLDRNPQAPLVFSDAAITNQQLMPVGYNLWEAVGLTPEDRRQLAGDRAADVLLRQFAVTGMTVAFRARYLQLLLPIDREWVHDAWIAFCLSAVGPLVSINQPLVRYRQHDEQQFGERKRTLWQKYRWAKQLGTPHLRRHYKMFIAMESHLRAKSAEWSIANEMLQKLNRKNSHLANRLHSRTAWYCRLGALSPLRWRDYATYSFGWQSVVQDLIA